MVLVLTESVTVGTAAQAGDNAANIATPKQSIAAQLRNPWPFRRPEPDRLGRGDHVAGLSVAVRGLPGDCLQGFWSQDSEPSGLLGRADG